MAVLQRCFWLAVVPIAIGAGLAWFGTPHSALLPTGQKAPDEPKVPVVPIHLYLVGSAGCSARNCHGSVGGGVPDPNKCMQNEYVHWIRDRHAIAYQVLKEERSSQIMKHLQSGTADKIQAYDDPRCLACHTNPQLTDALDEYHKREIAGLRAGVRLEPGQNRLFVGLDPAAAHLRDEKLFGVGCESCHGGASKWLVPHTDKSWRQLSSQEKWEKYDMVPVADPARLAQTCAGCHVGAPPDPAKGLPLRDVNHDLIAAGHPRLNFEFSSFLANMPPHWRQTTKKSQAHLWAVGQIATTQAAVDLLDQRAKTGPWPEFAEYDCYSCHHSLAQPTWRQRPERDGRPLGSPAWGSWYFLTNELGDKPPLTDLKKTMQTWNPDRAKAQAQARTAHQELQKQLEKFAGAKNERGEVLARQILDRLRKGTLKPEPSWDSAEQIYLALYAINLSKPKPDSAMTKLLDQLTPIRAFPRGFDGPSSWPVEKERAFNPQEFFDILALGIRH